MRVGETIWIDGGISKFSIVLEDEEVAVPDFSAYMLCMFHDARQR